ncbi:MAG: exopolysaccharide biosynthesis polyprenyl glycosylphosphotransferase [Eubacteriales bacterium]
MKKSDYLKRLGVLFLASLSLFLQIIIFALLWYRHYEGNIQVYFYEKGNWLVIAVYAVLLFMFYHMYGAFKIGYLKTGDVLFSQLFATTCMTLVAYAQISLLLGWFADPIPVVHMYLADIVVIVGGTFLAHSFYRFVYPPRKLVLFHGNRNIEDILYKFQSRSDKYKIIRCVNIEVGKEQLLEEIQNATEGVVIWDVDTAIRKELMKYCYAHSVRVYMMPKITDILVRGSEQLHLFDTPILLNREYSLTVGERVIKRTVDLVCAIFLCLITMPIMLIAAIVIHAYDKGPVLYKQVRCTRHMKEFTIYKFRSMRVDAEKDGVARLAKQNDNRITPIGQFIRMTRIDELPQLFNIIRGEMTFVGPRPERPEIIAQYTEQMPEFVLRTKVKAGLAGYAQVYGKYNTTPYDKLKLDLFYILNYSTWLDLKLMLLTLKILFKPESTEGVQDTQQTALKK